MRSKKILSLICSAALAVSAVALPIGGRPIFNDLKVSAEQADYEVYEYFNDGDWQCGFAKEEGKTRVWITGCNNTKATKLVVPSMVRGYRVTRILDFTTGGSTEMEMTDLTIPSSITYIKRAAFWQQCNKLKEIHVINNPRFEFKNGILYGRNLTKETGEKYEVYYNDEAHYYDMNKRVIKVCNQARQVEIEEGVDIIDNKAFDGLENLEHVVLPAGIKVIDDAAFLNCINLQEVTIPYGCEVIGASAFGGNLEMRNINLPSTLKYIGAGAFGSLPKLKSVYVPDSVEYIGSGAFTMDYDDGKGSKVTVYGNYKEPNEDGSVDDPIEEYCDRDNRAEYAPATDKDGNFIVDVTHDPDDPYDHFYIYAVNIKPTCTTPGALAGICFCGHTYYQPLPATGHAFALQGVDADGTAHYKCAVCGEEKTVKTGLVMNVMDKITSKETHDYSALEITVFDKDGAIAKDADVNGTSKAAVDSLEDGKYSALVSMAGFVPRTVEFSVTDGKAEEVDAELHRTGDITGDGNLNAADLLRAKSHIKGINSLEDYDYDCANVDENDKLNAADLLQMKAHVKGVNKLW